MFSYTWMYFVRKTRVIPDDDSSVIQKASVYQIYSFFFEVSAFKSIMVFVPNFSIRA